MWCGSCRDIVVFNKTDVMCIVILLLAAICFMVSFTGRAIAQLAFKRGKIDLVTRDRRLKVCRIFGLTGVALTFAAVVIYFCILG